MISLMIVDPDLQFALRIKGALDGMPDFAARVCGSANAALEALQSDPQDVAIIDFDVLGMPTSELVAALRIIQPSLFILVSPRTNAQGAQISNLDVQGSITKPYFARQLIPVLREAAAAKYRFEWRSVQSQNAHAKRHPPLLPPAEPLQPDATFQRIMETGRIDAHLIDTDKRTPAAEPVTTIAELVTGKTPAHQPAQPLPETGHDTARGKAVSTAPPTILPEASDLPDLSDLNELADIFGPPPDSEVIAKIALEVVTDAATPLDQVNVERVVFMVNDELSHTQAHSATQSIPVWSDAPDQLATPVEPADQAASLAAQFTQLIIDAAALGLIISRPGQVVHHVGEFPASLIPEVLAQIDKLWAKTLAVEDDLGMPPQFFKLITLENGADLALFSMPTVETMRLSLLFNANTTSQVINRLAKQIHAALLAVPEMPLATEPPAEPAQNVSPERATNASTTVERSLLDSSRQTTPPPSAPDRLPAPDQTPDPATLADSSAPVIQPVMQSFLQPAPSTSPQSDASLVVPPVKKLVANQTAYGLLWLPAAAALDLVVRNNVKQWLHAVTVQQEWQLISVDADARYIYVELALPDATPATLAAETLMRETAALAQNSDLWRESYFVSLPPHAPTPQTVANLIAFQREVTEA